MKRLPNFVNDSLQFIMQMYLFFAEHSIPIDVEAANLKFLAKSEDLWEAMESSAWWQYEETEEDETSKSSKSSKKATATANGE